MALRLDRKYHHRRASADTWDFALGVSTFLFATHDDPRWLRLGVAVALVLHIALMIVRVPALEEEPLELPESRQVFVLHQVRFQESRPQMSAPTIPTRQARKIPFPDPTPNLPEPIIEDYETPPVIFDVSDADFFDVSEIPDAPPAPSGSGTARDLDASILAPQRLSGDQPRYTEEARMTRVQGFVILRGVIDEEGNVAHLRVIKGLPRGLTESALETVGAWRYSPATQDGVPVAVFYVFNV
ncbi:MAG: TonB family protein [Acidobacteriota bacterium]|nr:TonB family protein [Acidobacteriota bacterium]